MPTKIFQDETVPPVLKSVPDVTATPTFREYSSQFSNVVWVGDIPWSLSGGMMHALPMPHLPLVVDRAELAAVMKRHKALVAYWTSDWDGPPSEWWFTCCDLAEYSVERIDSANGRQIVRRGLRDCTVRKMSTEEFATASYDVFCLSQTEYGLTPPTLEEYQKVIRKNGEYPGRDFWAAFVGEKPVAFCSCIVVDDAVMLASAKSDPAFHRNNSNGALFYTITKHYLDSGLKYFSNGSRTLVHPTTINDYLLKLGFRKVFCRVNVQLSPFAKIVQASGVGSWGKQCGLPKLSPTRWGQLEGFTQLVKIANSFSTK